MSGIYLKMPPVANVGAGNLGIISHLPMGMTYNRLDFKLSGTAVDVTTDIEYIKIILGGKDIVDLTGAELAKMNQYMGLTANSSYLSYHFYERNARTLIGEMIGALDTSIGYSNYQVQIKFAAGAPADIGCEVWAEQTAPKPAGPHKALFRACIKAVNAEGGANTYNWNVPVGTSEGALIKKIHFFHANMSDLEVKKDGINLLDKNDLASLQYLQNELTRVTQAGHFAYDPMLNDNQSDAITTMKKMGNIMVPSDFQWRVTLSAGDTVTTVSDIYTTLRGI